MATNIEKLQTRVDDTKNQIEKSKSLSAVEKVEKAKALESVISKIKSDLDALRISATPEQLAEIDALAASYEEMNEQFNLAFKQELSSLKEEVVDSVKETKDEENEIIASENDKPSRWEKNKKTVLIWAWTLWVWLLVRGRWKRRKARKEREEKWDYSDSEKKGFWKTWVGQVIKRWGIGVGAFLWIRRLLDYLKKWEVTDGTAEIYGSYLDWMENNKEDYAQYEQLWWQVNDFYDKARSSEIDNFWFESSTDMWSMGDDLEKAKWYEHVETKWMVPFCLDSYYANVDEMLSAWWYRDYIRKKSFAGYEQDIKKWSWDQINKFLVPFLSVFASWGTIWAVSSDSAQEKMTKFFDKTKDTKDRKQQLDMFFRQYAKMMTYMADKNNALKIKYATPILKQNWYDWDAWPSSPEEQQEMLLDATDNKSRIEDKLSWTPYWIFRESKILWASKVLEEEWLLDSNITSELQEIIDELDNDASNILWWRESNAIFDAKASLLNGTNVDQPTKTWMADICNNLIEDMWNEQDWWWFYDTFDYLAVWLDLDSAQQQELLKQSWMNQCFDKLTTDINKLKVEVSTNPTQENVEKLDELTWKYLALKKEFKLMMYAISQAKENKDNRDYVVQYFNGLMAFVWHTFQSMFDVLSWKWTFWDYPHFFVGLAISWWVLVITWRAIGGVSWKIITVSWRGIWWVGKFPVTALRYWLRRSWASFAIRNRLIRLAKDGNEANAQRLLYKAMSEWKITWADAVSAAEENKRLNSVVNNADLDADIKSLCKKILNLEDAEVDVLAKYYKENKRITKSLLNYSETLSIRTWKYTVTVKKNVEWFNNLKAFDNKVSSLTWNTKWYFDDIFKKLKNMDDIKLITELAGDSSLKSAIAKMDAKELKQFKKLSIQEVNKLKVNGKLNGSLSDMIAYLWKNKKAVIKAEKLAAEAVQEVVESLTPEWKKLLRSVDKQISHINDIMPQSNKTEYLKQIDWLEEFKKTLSGLEDADIKIYNKVFDNVEMRHFITMLDMIGELKAANATDEAIWFVVRWFANYDVVSIKNWLSLWNVTNFKKAVHWLGVWINPVSKITDEASKVWKLLKILKIL